MGEAITRFRVVTEPSYEPVSLDDVKTHCRIMGADDDTFLSGLITAARKHCEQIQGRAYITQTLRLYLHDFPSDDYIELPRAPLQSVTSVKYTPLATRVQLTMSSSLYVVDTISEPGRVVLVDGESWPSDELIEANGVEVEYVAGYGTVAEASRPTSMPWSIAKAILFLVAHWYENRELLGSTVGQLSGVPMAFNTLIAMERVGMVF